MTTVDLQAIRSELTVFLRNEDIISVDERGVTTVSDAFTGNGTQTDFILTNVGVKNVRSVTVDLVLQIFGVDYTVNYHSGVVAFLSAPVSLSAIAVSYDFGVGDRVYPDLPRIDLDLTSYPRVGFDDVSITSNEEALNAELIRSDILITMITYSNRKDELLEVLKRARDAIISNKKSFFFFQFITPTSTGPMVLSAGRSDKIMQKSQDFRIPFEFEVV